MIHSKKDTKESRIQSARESRGREDLQERKVFREFVITRERHTGFYNGKKREFFAARRRGEEERQQHGGARTTGIRKRGPQTRSIWKKIQNPGAEKFQTCFLTNAPYPVRNRFLDCIFQRVTWPLVKRRGAIITYSKGCRDVKHQFIHLSHHPSVRSSMQINTLEAPRLPAAHHPSTGSDTGAFCPPRMQLSTSSSSMCSLLACLLDGA